MSLKNLNKLLLMGTIFFVESVNGNCSIEKTSYPIVETVPQQFTRYILKYPEVEISLPIKFNDTINRFLIKKMSYMADTTYTEQKRRPKAKIYSCAW